MEGSSHDPVIEIISEFGEVTEKTTRHFSLDPVREIISEFG
jgi:hypothetical protein